MGNRTTVTKAALLSALATMVAKWTGLDTDTSMALAAAVTAVILYVLPADFEVKVAERLGWLPKVAVLAVLSLTLTACSASVPVWNDQTFHAALLDKLEGEDTQVEHDKVAGIQVGSVTLGIIERNIYRVPGARNASQTTTNKLDGQGQLIETKAVTNIGDLDITAP